MAINNLTTSNTFGQWVTTTQQLVSLANTLTDGPLLYCNTQLQLARPGVSLNVATDALFTGNIIANGVAATLNVTNNVSIGNTLTVTGNVVALNTSAGNLVFSRATATSGYANLANLRVANTTTLNDVTCDGTLTFDTAVSTSGSLSVFDLEVSNLAIIPNLELTSVTFTDLTASHLSASNVDTDLLYFNTGYANTGSLRVNSLTVLNDTNTKTLLVLGNTTTGNLSTTGAVNTSQLRFTTGRANTGSLTVYDLTVLNSANLNSIIGAAAMADPVVMAIALG